MKSQKIFTPKRIKRNLSASLENYKNQHKARAEEMGVLDKFLASPKLTRAKKIVFPK